MTKGNLWSAERIFRNMPDNFRNSFGANVFKRYRLHEEESLFQRARAIASNVVGDGGGKFDRLLPKDTEREIAYRDRKSVV